jgi:signal transduction histidine kinase
LSPSGGHDRVQIRQLLQALLLIGSESELPLVLRDITQAAVEVIDARSGAIVLLPDEGNGEAEITSVGLSLDQIDSIAGQPEGRGVLDTRFYLAVTIRGRDRLLGHLYLVEGQEGTEFSEEDADLAQGFATAAAIAIDHADLRLRVRDLAIVEDRERIAVDLHDTVTQRLFAISLSLQSTVKTIAPPEVAQRVSTAVDDLDQTVRQVRAIIFSPDAPKLVEGSHQL